MRSLLLLLVLVAGVYGWDQIKNVIPKVIFPFVSDDLLNELIDDLNSQNTTKDSLKVLDLWIDENWMGPPTTPVPSSNDYGRFVEKAYAREIAAEFLNHRAAVKAFIRYFYRTTQILDYFDQEEAFEMRKQFWKSDGFCYNDFDCTKRQIFLEWGTLFESTQPNATVDLEILAEPIFKLPGIGEKLEFVLRKH